MILTALLVPGCRKKPPGTTDGDEVFPTSAASNMSHDYVTGSPRPWSSSGILSEVCTSCL